MSLADLIKKRPLRIATATPAIPAIPSAPVSAPVARKATIAVATLQKAELFEFSPPGDPAIDDEALQERVAIMMEGNGWNEAKALQEASWHADKERCWRTFQITAKRVLEAPNHQRQQLLARDQTEASGRYGETTGVIMAEGLRDWVMARAVH